MNNFNAIRLLLSLLVVLSHSYEIHDNGRTNEPLTAWFGTLSFGDLAVDGFFMVSGYLILKSWSNTKDWSTFAKRRLLRIAPAFWVAYLVSGLLIGPLFDHSAAYWLAFDWPLYVRGLVSFSQPLTPPVFSHSIFSGVNVSLWSIQYELACYALVAITGLVAKQYLKRYWCSLLLVFATLHLAGKFPTLFQLEPYAHVLAKSFIRLPMYFLVGGLFHLYPTLLSYKYRWWMPAAALMVLGGLGHPEWADLSLALGGSFILIRTANQAAPAFIEKITRTDISYGLYLYAWPASQAFYEWMPGQTPVANFICASLAGAWLGFLSWKIVEAPALRFK
jgi:peptidoglycan/LPS O-acetylase OafA/YrhL